MSKLIRKGITSFLVLAILVSLLSSLGIFTSATDVSYQYNGNYIYNWGTRGEVATFLSPNAKAFYEDNHTSYDTLASYSGSSDRSKVTQSSLYRELQNLMAGAQSYQTSYAATKNLFQYTDCQNSGGKISSFYSGTLIGPAWDSSSWNREHTWPNSKGLNGKDEDDIMMLRPTSISENSSRGNTAYGQSSGYYNPNSESGGKYDLRGDVARIFLYVYVRWGNDTYAWGKSGVMESVEVLLAWMEADPVDTWELGRNDSVESITGTRNVFVDYPELGFILFGAEVPEDLTTPSGEGNSDCGHNNFNSGVVVAATCTEKGYTIYTCKTAGCGYSYVTDSTPMTAHNYVNDVCSACGAVKSNVTEAAIDFVSTANRIEFSTTRQVWSQNGITFTNNKSTSTNAVADYVNPVRLYANSEVIVESSLGNIAQIVFDCNSGSYATVLQASIGAAATVSDDKVTVTLDGSANSFTVSKLTAQVRLDALTVTFETDSSQEPPVDKPSNPAEEALNALTPSTSLGYKYATSVEQVEIPGKSATIITDILNLTFTGRPATTSYGSWSDKSGASGAVYAGQSAGDKSSIQIRSKNSNSGIVTTASGGKIKTITVVWTADTTNGRTLNIYGKNSAYSSASDLYSNSTQGTLLGTIVYGQSTTLEISGDYEYIGFRSADGAMYLTSVSIEWETAVASEPETVEKEICKDSEFAFRFGVGDAIASIEGIEAYGLVVSAGGKEVYYSSTASSWKQDDGMCYVTVLLGDIINDTAKLTTKFTVKAYVQVDGNTYYTVEKTYSVVDMIVYYYEQLGIQEVTHLYDYLANNKLI